MESKKDNRLENLEISNPSHNQLHAYATGLRAKNSTSRYRYVSVIKSKNNRAKGRFAVCIKHAGKSSYGWRTFEDEIEAAKYADELLDSIGDTIRKRNFPKTS